MAGTATIEIVEVSPRDGLQNEAATVSTADKLALIDRAIAAGARRIEVTSFVNPARVPQLADADAVVAGLPERDDVTFIALVLNRRGAERALATRIDELGAVCVASDTFAMRNQKQTSAESLLAARDTVALARAGGRSGQITIAAAFGCPFEGEVPLQRVIDMARRAADVSPREVALADTIGVAVPAQVAEAVARVAEAVAPLPVRVHLHDTRGTGIANVWAAIGAGATVIDASLGGTGGCPFAPGASGNVATEDVLYLLDRSGIATGYDRGAAIEGARWLGGVLGRDLPGKLGRAPQFPPVGA
ncbi:hydroxymethylglutaryl-CoA lyase [Sphingomonas sp. IC4-52]|uniref:hydroxymethylglutaryl-CoA lyase n=1 Tax=Sphingomonas sp. IC4-52 TaxID=2887202 RepID=UPI001D1235BD|nr:hydroxymethylglutaryl-CoA lyase [Sphingomonas sp. IC4-52]MCC2981098.1 hydroxymethylglutaryl-CoA lyase [Sphingomonas sp. IC4-52]